VILIEHISIAPGFERMNGELVFSRPAIITGIALVVAPPVIVGGSWERLAGLFFLDNDAGMEVQEPALIHLNDDPDFDDPDLDSSEVDIAWRKQEFTSLHLPAGRFIEWNYEDKLKAGPYTAKAIIQYQFQP